MNWNRLLLLLLLLPCTLWADHPVDVQRKSLGNQHYEAWLSYLKLPKRKVTDETRLAAARSAWALGLVEEAKQEYDLVLRAGQLNPVLNAKTLLSRGIIEYQDGRYQIAIIYAEKLISELATPGPLRARGFLLLADSLTKLGSYGAAEQKYQSALAEAEPALHGEIYYSLGKVQYLLGKMVEAQESLEKVPLDHDRTDQALHLLSELALNNGDYQKAAIWLEKGKSEYPQRFLDSWYDYALLQIAGHEQQDLKVEQIETDAQTKYPASDPWLILLQAESELEAWKRIESGRNAN